MMPERATPDKVQADMSPPNYRSAVKLLRTIEGKKKKIASVNGEIGGVFDRVTGFKCNKKGARIFLMLDGLEQKERDDILRTLDGLINVAEWGDLDDMVDNAEDNVRHVQFGRSPVAEEDDDDASDEDLEEALGEKPETSELGAALEDGLDPAFSEASEAELSQQEGRKQAARAKLDAAGGAETEEGKKGRGRKPSFNADKIGPDTEPYTGDNSDLAGE